MTASINNRAVSLPSFYRGLKVVCTVLGWGGGLHAAFVYLAYFAVGTSSWAATELRVGNVFAVPGGKALVPVRLISDTNIAAVQFDLLFANTNLSGGDATGGSALADHQVTSGCPQPAIRRVVVYSPSNATMGNGPLAYIPLTCDTNTGYGPVPLLLTNILLVNSAGVAVAGVSPVLGSLTCTSSIPPVPVIVLHPSPLSLSVGARAEFETIACGQEPLSYQWCFNNTPIAGATDALFLRPSLVPGDIGNYTAVVTNFQGAVTSAVATLTIPTELMYLAVGGNGQVRISPAASQYFLGQQITLSPTPGRWYAFSQWSDGNADNPRTISIGLTNNYTAMFTNTQPLEWWTNMVSGQTWELPVGMPKVFLDGQLTFGGNVTFTSTNPPLVDFATSFPGGYIAYTLDGSDPLGGNFYDGTPFVLNDSSLLRAVSFDASYDRWEVADPVSITVIPVYSLAVATSGTGSVLVNPPGGTYLSNAVVALTATPAPGWGFSGWSGDATDRTSTVMLRMDGSKAVLASFYQIPLYALIVVTNGNGSVTVDPPVANHLSNSVVHVAAAPAPEWYFNGWIVDAGGVVTNASATNLTLVLNQPVTVTALFGAVPKYWLNLSTPGGGSVAFGPTNNPILRNEVVTLTATTNVGWTFLGWTGAASGTNPVINVNMDQSRNIQAIFGTMLTTTTIGGGTIQRSPGTGPYAYASTVRLSAVPATTNYFRLWGGAANGLSNSPLSFVVTNANPTVSAIFAALPTNGYNYSLTVLVNGRGSVTKSPQLAFYTNGVNVTLAATPDTDWFFTGWTGDASGAVTPLGVTMNTNKTITANFLAIAAPLITLQPQDQHVFEGGTAAFSVTASGVPSPQYQWWFNVTNLLPAATNAALQFTNVQLSRAGQYNCVASNLAGSATSAVAILTVTVTNIPPSISSQPLGLTALAGSNATFSVTADGTAPLSYQWRFKGGAVADGTTTSLLLTNVQANQAGAYDVVMTNVAGAITSSVATLTVQYALAVFTDGNGSVGRNPDRPAYDPGSLVAVTAVPSANCHFTGWSGVLSGVSNPASLLMDGHKSLTANFATNLPPVVSLDSPTNGAVFTAPAPITLGAVATDEVAVAHVDFFAGTNLLASVGQPVTNNAQFYTYTWTNAPVGTSVLSAVTMATSGLRATSAPVTVILQTALPQIVFASPTNGASFLTPATIAINALASDADNSISNVTIYAGATLLATFAPQANNSYNFTWSNVTVGSYTLTAQVQDLYGPTVTSASVNITVYAPPGTNAPVFTLITNAYSVLETAGLVTVTVLKSPNSTNGVVNFRTADGTGIAVGLGVGNYTNRAGSLNFASAEFSKTVAIGIKDNSGYYTGDRTFSFILESAGDGSSVGNPNQAAITIRDVDSLPSSNSVTLHLNSDCLSDHSGLITVQLIPTNSGGQWRLAREIFWRNSGGTVSNLTAGSYEVEFKPVPGFLVPDNLTVVVPSGAPTPLQTNFPYARQYPPSAAGSLTVTLNPASGQWRLLGDTNWLVSGATVGNLLAGNHVVEFNSLAGYATPPLQTAIVPAGATNYTVSYQAPSNLGWFQPAAVPFNLATPCAPFSGDAINNYAGELLTDSGFGSGCVVKPRVVLTAAHVIFNDLTLSYVSNVRWFFQREAGQYEPPQQRPRGSYVLTGYATARTNDVPVVGPGNASLGSRSQDAAALYFYEDAGRGGQSGYLVATNATGGQFLQSSVSMTMLGYPVEGVGDTARGRLFNTPTTAYSFVLLTNGVFSTTTAAGLPGMSGGPVCVQYNGWYYPAGIYLGGAQQSVVRAIDGAVADLINRADVNGNTGNNYTGGGVLILRAMPNGTATKAYVQLTLGPAPAVVAGAGWRLLGDTSTDFQNDPDFTYAIQGGNGIAFEFKPITGWNLPPDQSIAFVLGTVTNVVVNYRAVNPTLRFIPGQGLGLSGSIGARYRLEYRTNLTSGTWQSLTTNRPGAGFNVVLPWPPTNGSRAFYRAVWLPN